MTYREAATMEQRETWGDKARAVVRVAKWLALAGMATFACGHGLVALHAMATAVPPCQDAAALLNSAGTTRIDCDHRATLTVTQVTTGQLARCTCGGAR